MSTFLAICQRTREECGITGTGPSTVTGQTGQLGRLVNHVINSWAEIQERHLGWRWMRRTATVNTTADDGTYAPADWTDSTDSVAISRFGRWLVNDFDDPAKCYLTSTGVGGEYWLSWTDWNYFKGVYKIGSQTSSAPAHISVDPNNNIVIGPAPSAVYTLTVDYQMSPQILAADADTPEMPSQFHTLIVYRAMEKFGRFENAEEIIWGGAREGGRVMRALEVNQLPMPRLGRPMA